MKQQTSAKQNAAKQTKVRQPKAKAKKPEVPDVPFLLRHRPPLEKWYYLPLFFLYQIALMTATCLVLTVCTLRLSYSNFTSDIFKGYFEHPIIFWTNYAIVASVFLAFFALIGKAWIAFLVTSLVCMGVAIGNYFLIIIRNDPLQYEDLTCIREALAITDKQGYELRLSFRLVWSIAACVGVTALLALFSRWTMRINVFRILPLALAAWSVLTCYRFCRSTELVTKTKYYNYINTWSTTEIYVSRGVIYSFARSAVAENKPPEGYSEADTAALLASYSDQDIPEDRKVDVFVIMRESYADLSGMEFEAGSIDWSCYDAYHALAEDAVLRGTLITNGFGGNTKNAERCFLTGNYYLKEWRKPANSYVWYLRAQGYRTEGAHPFDGWFYNRRNINRYLGFENYMLREDGFDELVGENKVADDDVLYDEIWRMYQERDPDKPYFNFSVTYEGHGPYHYKRNDYDTRFVLKDANSDNGFAMNNYLSCVYKRDQELMVLIERFRASDRPIVLLTYGDHKATLGTDVNNYTTAAYQHYGANMDLSTEDGYENYYGTEYLIWMNDAAREVLGLTDAECAEGPRISPCYLMNVLFDTLGWGDGPAYLQTMDHLMERFPVYSTKGRYGVNGKLAKGIPVSWMDDFHSMQYLCYYWRTNFFYDDVK